ncbi:hypothetical protein ACFUV2_12250 [Streptomyces pilosus]|uniref:hypothetical protein n=1 Tax=Streptomyces pilosus TaxID=28893 RepID=UPI0016799796|nr:hypothetical protein [Streptomyces pilosus]GGV48444.1 hypothetical protein GCM10010261_24950 [Streptomyces pilosus]
MTVRAGEPYDIRRAVSAIESALAAPLPGPGPTADEGEPVTGEWASTRGEGFVLFPLWESDSLTGVYDRDWTDAETAAEANLAALVAELDTRWGPHRTLPLTGPESAPPAGEPFRTLLAKDCDGDLALWAPPAGPASRWAAVSLSHSDGDAPFLLTALVTDRPLEIE